MLPTCVSAAPRPRTVQCALRHPGLVPAPAGINRRCIILAALSSPAEPSNDPTSSSTRNTSGASTSGSNAPLPAAQEKKGLWAKVKGFFTGGQMDKEKLAALGMGAFASYGVVSNVTYGACMAIAWITFVKTTGQSPLAPGQWQGFLAVYAGLWAIQNLVRPLRFTLALAMAPLFERGIDWIGAKLRIKRQWAFTVLLLGVAAGTITGLVLAIWLGGGFPSGAAAALGAAA